MLERIVAVLLGTAILCQAVGFYWKIIRWFVRFLSGRIELPFEVRRRETERPLLPNEEGG